MKSISSRLTFWYALVVTATIAVVLLVGRFFLEQNLIEGVDLMNDAEFEEIRSRLETVPVDSLPADFIQVVKNHTEIDDSLFYFQIGFPDNKEFFQSSNLAGHPLPKQVSGENRLTVDDVKLGKIRVGQYSIMGLDVQIASSLRNEEAFFRNYTRNSLFLLLLLFLLSLVIGYILSRLGLKPIADIQRTANRISAKNLTERIPVPKTGDEVAHLAAFLNEMFDRLEVSFNQIAQFTADASHELRTPLTLIRLQTEKLLSKPDMSWEDRNQMLVEQMEDIGRLDRLINDLLFLAKADSGVMRLNLQSVDIGDFLIDFREDAKALSDEKSIEFNLHLNEGECILFDPIWMRHVLLNLLSNALRVSASETTIALTSHYDRERMTWQLTLEDEGPGLSEDKLSKIFDRFVRANPVPGSDIEDAGSGLGLAICQSIVRQHMGSIYAENRTQVSGLRVVVEIPNQ